MSLKNKLNIKVVGILIAFLIILLLVWWLTKAVSNLPSYNETDKISSYSSYDTKKIDGKNHSDEMSNIYVELLSYEYKEDFAYLTGKIENNNSFMVDCKLYVSVFLTDKLFGRKFNESHYKMEVNASSVDFFKIPINLPQGKSDIKFNYVCEGATDLKNPYYPIFLSLYFPAMTKDMSNRFP